MPEGIHPLQLVLFAVFGLLVVLWMARLSRFARGMRERHRAVHDDLGLDTIWSKYNSRATVRLVRFLARREYGQLDDPEIERLAGAMRTQMLGQLALFAALAATVLWPDLLPGGERTRAAQAEVAGSPVEEGRQRAYQLHRERRWAEALAIYDELLGEIGNDAEMVYYRGVARHNLRRYDEALVDYRRVMDLDPGRYDAYLNADRILSMQRRFDDCVDLWSRYLRVVPGDALAHMERGGSHFHRGDYASAYSDAKRACELGESRACPLAERAKARM